MVRSEGRHRSFDRTLRRNRTGRAGGASGQAMTYANASIRTSQWGPDPELHPVTYDRTRLVMILPLWNLTRNGRTLVMERPVTLSSVFGRNLTRGAKQTSR